MPNRARPGLSTARYGAGGGRAVFSVNSAVGAGLRGAGAHDHHHHHGARTVRQRVGGGACAAGAARGGGGRQQQRRAAARPVDRGGGAAAGRRGRRACWCHRGEAHGGVGARAGRGAAAGVCAFLAARRCRWRDASKRKK